MINLVIGIHIYSTDGMGNGRLGSKARAGFQI